MNSIMSKNIKIKYIRVDHNKIENNFNYPIGSFLSGNGSWTYNDVDSLLIHSYCAQPYILLPKHNKIQKYMYCNLKLINYVCENNGKVCHTDKNSNDIINNDYKPTIAPKQLLNIKTWKKIYYYQEGQNDDAEWVIFCKTIDNVYIYLRASCDYTGFDCQGGGMISFSRNKKHIWNLGLDNFGRTMVLAKNGIKMNINLQ